MPSAANDLPAEEFLGKYFLSVTSQSENFGCQTIGLVAHALGKGDFNMEVIDVKTELIKALKAHWKAVQEKQIGPLRETTDLPEGAAFGEFVKIMREGFGNARAIIDLKAKEMMAAIGKKA